MSGGAYEYKYKEIEGLAEMLSPTYDKYQPFRKRVAEVLRQVARLCHDVEWIDSGDYGEEDWKNVEIWLGNHGF